MKVYALVGPSGTGKSHKSSLVARDMGITHIIDDGLLIGGNRVVAGTSAKREKTKMASVRHALFYTEEHRRDVARAIKTKKVDSILILGTSDKMVRSIAEKLNLPEIERTIYIQDISDEEEINTALSHRKDKGKHVIPVPTFEIKNDFSGYLLDPLYVFRRKGKNKYVSEGSKTIVRPTFSYLGSYTISNNTLFQIARHVASKVEGFESISRFRVINREEGISIEMSVVVNYNYTIINTMRLIQKNVADTLEKLTALHLASLDITVKSIVINGAEYP
ncbi:MAG: Asp23/Gls24 family envelope stress response protein [Clostridia bacterium]|nr:Asp23/Gls24 family envelope stress response protein [Clostridia bacterium]MBN2883980.1 Asp23/Gls24 family envelope stress response protein [Clostridia bacterium]